MKKRTFRTKNSALQYMKQKNILPSDVVYIAERNSVCELVYLAK